MINKIITSVPFLVGQATEAIGGLDEHAGYLNVPHSVAADLPGRLAALTAGENSYQESKLQLHAARVELESLVHVIRRFMMVARETLKSRLGVKYSRSWEAAGFAHNLQLPRSADPLLSRLQLMRDYLTAHPIEDAGDHLDAARASTLYDQIEAAIVAVADRKCIADQALNTRNEKVKAMEKGLRTLLSELHLVLSPLDPRWFGFGFQKPGQKKAPEAPKNIASSKLGSIGTRVEWEPSARATHYRVWKKTVGIDTDYVAIDSSTVPEIILEEVIESGTEVCISAVNSSGESGKSEVIKLSFVNNLELPSSPQESDSAEFEI